MSPLGTFDSPRPPSSRHVVLSSFPSPPPRLVSIQTSGLCRTCYKFTMAGERDVTERGGSWDSILVLYPSSPPTSSTRFASTAALRTTDGAVESTAGDCESNINDRARRGMVMKSTISANASPLCTTLEPAQTTLPRTPPNDGAALQQRWGSLPSTLDDEHNEATEASPPTCTDVVTIGDQRRPSNDSDNNNCLHLVTAVFNVMLCARHATRRPRSWSIMGIEFDTGAVTVVSTNGPPGPEQRARQGRRRQRWMLVTMKVSAGFPPPHPTFTRCTHRQPAPQHNSSLEHGAPRLSCVEGVCAHTGCRLWHSPALWVSLPMLSRIGNVGGFVRVCLGPIVVMCVEVDDELRVVDYISVKLHPRLPVLCWHVVVMGLQAAIDATGGRPVRGCGGSSIISDTARVWDLQSTRPEILPTPRYAMNWDLAPPSPPPASFGVTRAVCGRRDDDGSRTSEVSRASLGSPRDVRKSLPFLNCTRSLCAARGRRLCTRSANASAFDRMYLEPDVVYAVCRWLPIWVPDDARMSWRRADAL
ncbi:hypothetical protein D9611_013011 [Ephemerocybe angulata]|uniref:Uncharacterized protein n=1 Tax=Ephemerocybe angulata TaxID=980116 RepID=A0A8H5ESX7_9AGAR|nr:hypothetical protein D9611_013011 [Tulosesus angulatus]